MIDKAIEMLKAVQFSGEAGLCHFCRGQDPKYWTRNVWGTGHGGYHNGHKTNCRLQWLLEEYDEMREIL